MQRILILVMVQAAEAITIRACGNIHYWLSVKPGATQGKKAGELIIERILKK